MPKATPLTDEQKAAHQRLMDFEAENCAPAKISNGGMIGKAARQMLLAGYTEEQIKGCYHYLKRDPFWRDKHVHLGIVQQQMASYFKAQQVRSAPPIGQIPSDSKALVEYLARCDAEEQAYAEATARYDAATDDEKEQWHLSALVRVIERASDRFMYTYEHEWDEARQTEQLRNWTIGSLARGEI